VGRGNGRNVQGVRDMKIANGEICIPGGEWKMMLACGTIAAVVWFGLGLILGTTI
jgi:type IV secretory pathway TrbD component